MSITKNKIVIFSYLKTDFFKNCVVRGYKFFVKKKKKQPKDLFFYFEHLTNKLIIYTNFSFFFCTINYKHTQGHEQKSISNIAFSENKTIKLL